MAALRLTFFAATADEASQYSAGSRQQVSVTGVTAARRRKPSIGVVNVAAADDLARSRNEHNSTNSNVHSKFVPVIDCWICAIASRAGGAASSGRERTAAAPVGLA
jgi:hypothetical protein